MSCSNCIIAKPIPECTGLLQIGTLDIDTEYWVWITNLTLQSTYRQTVISDEFGVLYLDLQKPAPSFYSSNFDYELYVTTNDINMNDKLPITIDSIEYDCFNLSFFKINGQGTTYSNDYDINYSKVSTDLFILAV